MSEIYLKVGNTIRVKNDFNNYFLYAGKTKKITEVVEKNKKKSFRLDNEKGIWYIKDFDFCLESPNSTMK